MSSIDPDDREEYRTPLLVGQQLAYLAHGDTGEDNTKSLERTILENKLPKLSGRFQYLIEDLALLHAADFVDADDWSRVWEDLTESAKQNPVVDFPKGIKIPQRALSDYTLGIQLGHLARLLGTQGSPDCNQTHVACGFLLGLAGEFMHDPTKPSPSRDSNLVNMLAEPPSDVLTDVANAQAKLIDSVSEAADSMENKRANKALVDVGLKQYAPLRDALLERTKQRIEWLDESMHVTDEELLASSASNLKSDPAVAKAEELADEIILDLQALEDRTSGKIDSPVYATEVLVAVCSENHPTADNIQSRIQDARRDKPADQVINELRNDLAGVRSALDRWSDYPLIKESGNGYQATAYGQFIGLLVRPGTAVEPDPYLPDPDHKGAYTIPSDEQVLETCYACALDQSAVPHRELFDVAYDERISAERGGSDE